MTANTARVQSASPPASERTTVKRRPERGLYDPAVIKSILDEGLVCHLGFSVGPQPYVLPTIYARDGERILIHGSAASRMLRHLRSGVDVCATVTLVDGLVLARSAYHHSVNYRSVVVLGKAIEITDRSSKLTAMRLIVNHVVPGRWDEVRAPSETEIRATIVLALPLNEASAKARTGPPVDDVQDYALTNWAGVLPLSLDAHAPIADPRLRVGIQVPSNVRFYRRGVLSGGIYSE